jgi:hypothetical protein
MNPDPTVVLALMGISIAGAVTFVAFAIAIASFVLPRIEGWCARHDNGLIAALALSEDAGLPWESKQRAKRLFLSHLDPKQRLSWQMLRRCEVSAASGRRYTLSRYRPFNVHTGDAVFCVQVHGQIPVYDKLLAQKLLIESDEGLFLARANVRTFNTATWKPLMDAARGRYPN